MRFPFLKFKKATQVIAAHVEPSRQEILLCKAHELIDKNWIRRAEKKYIDHERGYGFCTIGAVREAAEQLNYPNLEVEAALKRLAKKMEPKVPNHHRSRDPQSTIIRFNDAHAGGKKDVVNVFCEAIADVRKETGRLEVVDV